MPETHWHVRSAITGARVIIDVPRDVAESEVDRLNEEARTGFRKPLEGAAGRLSDGTQDQGHRLVAENTGQALTSATSFPEQHATFLGPDNLVVQVPVSVAATIEATGKYQRLAGPVRDVLESELLDPSLVGKVLHGGRAMEYEIEKELRPTEEEIEEERRRLEAEREQA